MQTVIDIDDNLYTRLFDNGNIDAVDMLKACVSIRKGTPLPKGHGRLIDADKLTESILCQTFGLRGVDIDNAPTIIEADKKESEE